MLYIETCLWINKFVVGTWLTNFCHLYSFCARAFELEWEKATLKCLEKADILSVAQYKGCASDRFSIFHVEPYNPFKGDKSGGEDKIQNIPESYSMSLMALCLLNALGMKHTRYTHTALHLFCLSLIL